MARVANATLFMKFEEGDDLGRNFGKRYILNTATEEKTATTKKKGKNAEEVDTCYDIARGKTVLGNVDPTRHLFKTIIQIRAGARRPQETIYIHKELLESFSPVFSTFFDHHYSDSACRRPRPIDITTRTTITTSSLPPPVNPIRSISLPPPYTLADVIYLAQYLYTRTLSHELLIGPHPAYFLLLRLYVLASAFGISSCKNAVVDMVARVSERSNSVMMPGDTVMVYKYTSEGDKLRVLLVDLFVGKECGRVVWRYGGWDEQFMRDLVVGLKAKDGARLEPWRCEREYCERYHEHDEWAPRTGKAPCRDYV